MVHRSSTELTQYQALVAIANAVSRPRDNDQDRRWWTRSVFLELEFDVVIQTMIPQTLYGSDNDEGHSSRLEQAVVISKLESLRMTSQRSHPGSHTRREASAGFIKLLKSVLTYRFRCANVNSPSTNRNLRYTEEVVWYLHGYVLHEEMPIDILLNLCTTLASVLPEIDKWSTWDDTVNWTIWEAYGIHQYFTKTINLRPFCSVSASEETVTVDGVTVHLPSAIDALNSLREAMKVNIALLR